MLYVMMNMVHSGVNVLMDSKVMVENVTTLMSVLNTRMNANLTPIAIIMLVATLVNVKVRDTQTARSGPHSLNFKHLADRKI